MKRTLAVLAIFVLCIVAILTLQWVVTFFTKINFLAEMPALVPKISPISTSTLRTMFEKTEWINTYGATTTIRDINDLNDIECF